MLYLDKVINTLLSKNEYYMRVVTFDTTLFKNVLVTVDKTDVLYKECGIYKVYFRTTEDYDVYADLRYLIADINNAYNINIYIDRKGPSSFLKKNNYVISPCYLSLSNIYLKLPLKGITLQAYSPILILDNIHQFLCLIKSQAKLENVDRITFSDTTTFNIDYKSQKERKISELKKILPKIMLYAKENKINTEFSISMLMDDSGYEKKFDYVKELYLLHEYLYCKLKDDYYRIADFFTFHAYLSARDTTGYTYFTDIESYNTMFKQLKLDKLWVMH